jgi:hypothetical protein
MQESSLFVDASEFYTWYMCKLSNPCEQAQVFELLSQVMQMAKLSHLKGGYLAQEAENFALEEIKRLRENLLDRKMQKQEVLFRMQSIRDRLIFGNPKAAIVSCATQLEYKFCLAKSSHPEAGDLKEKLDLLLNHVTPSLSHPHAQAISQILSQVLQKNTCPAAMKQMGEIDVLLHKT